MLLSEVTDISTSRSVLVHPRRRLSAEIGWFPGVRPTKVAEAVSLLNSNPKAIQTIEGLPGLARSNLLADGLVQTEDFQQTELINWIIELAFEYENIDCEQTASLINEDRSVAGFPSLTDYQVLEMELSKQGSYYTQVLKSSLDKLPSKLLVEVVTEIVENTTNLGQCHAPEIVEELIDGYEVEAQAFFDAELKNIDDLIGVIAQSVANGKGTVHVENVLAKLEKVVKNWDSVAQPIQVIAQSKGSIHNSSKELAANIRELSLHLNNEYGLLALSKRLTDLQQEVFAEDVRIIEVADEDAIRLEEIHKDRQRVRENVSAWERDITFETKIGLIFKKTLRISPKGVHWHGRSIPLNLIERIRWGGVMVSSTWGTPQVSYQIAVASNRKGKISIELENETIYTEFVDRLWKAVGVRILVEMLNDLRDEKRLVFGDSIVSDLGVEIEMKYFFRLNKKIRLNWMDVKITNENGSLIISDQTESEATVSLSYLEVDNLHLLESAIRSLKENRYSRLSDMLNESN